MTALFRQFTPVQLKAYGGAAAVVLDAVLGAFGSLPGSLWLRSNPFEEPEREVSPAEARSILADAEKLGMEVFDLFWRDPAAAGPFPFLFRVCAAQMYDAYKYQERLYARLSYPPPCPHGYRIDCAFSTALLERAGTEAILKAFEGLFVSSGAVYGYATVADPLTVFSGYSDLERERNAPDRKYKRMWCDSLRQNVSGAFAANWLGLDLASRLEAPPGAGWEVKDLGTGGRSVLAREGLTVGTKSLQELEAWMADLLPPVEVRVVLPEMVRDSIVLQPAEVARLGSPAFLETAWKVRELKNGRAVLTAEYRFRSDEQVPGECLWLLRPTKRELWEIDVPSEGLVRASRLVPVTEPVRAQVRFRISEEELVSVEGVRVYVAVTGPGAAKGLKNALQALRAFGRFEVTAETPKITEGRIWLDKAGLDESVELVESVRAAVGSRSSFLLAVGAMSEEELDMRLRMTGPDRLYMKL